MENKGYADFWGANKVYYGILPVYYGKCGPSMFERSMTPGRVRFILHFQKEDWVLVGREKESKMAEKLDSENILLITDSYKVRRPSFTPKFSDLLDILPLASHFVMSCASLEDLETSGSSTWNKWLGKVHLPAVTKSVIFVANRFHITSSIPQAPP